MLKVVHTRNEFEGQVTEELALVEGRPLAPWKPGTLEVVGHAVRRVDGEGRVTGRARYTCDLAMPGMLHAAILRSPYARARVVRVDARAALALPGVHAVLDRFTAPVTPYRGENGIFREVVRFAGDEVAAVAADTERIAREALAKIVVDYEVLPHAADLDEAMGAGAPALEDGGNVHDAGTYARGDTAAALGEATHAVSVEYRTSTQLHNSMETHGAVAHWDGDTLTVWESTQHVFGVRAALRSALGLPFAKLRVLCDHMGGGFGSKGGMGKYTVIAALFARSTGRPVRCVLTREEENLAAGNRSATIQRLKLGVRRGRITAIEHESWSSTGPARWAANPTGPTNILYDVPNIRTHAHRVTTSTGQLSAFRAPGYVEGTFALESAVDELALAAGLDPLALRIRHARSQRDLVSGMRYSLKRLAECYEIGAREIGWSRRGAEGSRGSSAARRRGIGMASQTWSGNGIAPAYATLHLNSDGSAVVRTGTQDIGTGTKTILSQIVAEELGISVDAVRIELGDTNAPYAPISAGSLTAASIGPAVRVAAADAAAQLLQVAAGVLEIPATELRLAGGGVVSHGRSTPIAQVLKDLDNWTVIGRGARRPNPSDLVTRTFGAQFVELEVDTETGEVWIDRIVAVHDVGRVLNPKLARSQIEGGIIQGLGFALTEERIVDRATGRVLNGNFEGYKVPTIRDVPAIVVRFIDKPDHRANELGAKGLGEPPIIPTAPAIANAIANACGARVRHTPMTPARVLAALAR